MFRLRVEEHLRPPLWYEAHCDVLALTEAMGAVQRKGRFIQLAP